jgi:bifunctional non-homologous end joining protein LigD
VRGAGERACLYAFDLLEVDGEQIRREPLEQRKARLKRLLGRRKRTLHFVDHIEGDGAQVFQHACKLDLEGIVSKRRDLPYKPGPCRSWVKVRNPAYIRRGGEPPGWR